MSDENLILFFVCFISGCLIFGLIIGFVISNTWLKPQVEISAQLDSNISQQTKDKIKQEMNKTLDFILEETSPQKINQLVYAELKKKQVEKLSDGVKSK